MMALIVANVCFVAFETVPWIESEYHTLFYWFDVFSVSIFSVEYLLRIWSCCENPRYASPLLGRIKFAYSPMMLVDLIAILPFYLPLLMNIDLRFMRTLRLMRLLRILKLARYSEAYDLIAAVMLSRRVHLLISFLFVLQLLVLASFLMYFIEHEKQPDAFSSIPAALWWGAVTMTTVGYGDIYPATNAGKILAGFIAMLGIGLFGLPAGIIASGFSEELHNRTQKICRKCPHCGGDIDH
jgi:voltage-gated potassium channel